MICQRCGQRDATVHLVDLVDERRRSRWLCEVCAGLSEEESEGTPEFNLGSDNQPDNSDEDAYSLASFLGQIFESQGETTPPEPPACSACGFTFDQFRQTNQLGCPRCYDAFRRPLLSILGHLHRHVSHLGKSPRPADRPGLLGRLRVALEKAIVQEDFEKAARLRDEIHRLESSAPREGDAGS